MFALMKDSLTKPSKEEVQSNLERITHVLEEAAHRGMPVPEPRADPDRLMKASARIKIAAAGMEWLAANIAHVRDRPEFRDREPA